MITKTTKNFQEAVLKNMTFTAYPYENYILYKNEKRSELGYFIKYGREDYYEFSIGDYTIPHDFSLCFNHQEELMRFGTVYMGETEFVIEQSPISSFTPSSFFVVEKGLVGRPLFPNTIDFDDFLNNHTYRYLPLSIISIIQNLLSHAQAHTLTPIYLESKILEALALLYQEVHSAPNNAFSTQLNHGQVKTGTNRYITLSTSDVRALQKAYDILTKEAAHPPTIKALSQMVFLNEQKLKAGFSAKYHMSISEYTQSIRIAMAENLLSTTELSIEEVAKEVGYHHSGNFIKMFKKYHGKTPLAFRKMNHGISSATNNG
ncbi:MAG: AraC family transcriptional regulator [Cellulosilyticum sp.]|nr:AraC family transcriptional regulator [Cellulosilyticum sp.]